MISKYQERIRCDCCREWLEAAFDNRIYLDGKTYHWDCYWRIIWPQKAREERLRKAMKQAVKYR